MKEGVKASYYKFIPFILWNDKKVNISFNLINKKVGFIFEGINIQMSNNKFV